MGAGLTPCTVLPSQVREDHSRARRRQRRWAGHSACEGKLQWLAQGGMKTATGLGNMAGMQMRAPQ